MKTSSYDECEGSDVNDSSKLSDEATMSEVKVANEIETDINVIFKKVNPVYFTESNVSDRESRVAVSQGYDSDYSITETTSVLKNEDYPTETKLDGSQEKIEAQVFEKCQVNQIYLQTVIGSELEANVTQERNHMNPFNTEAKVKTPEESNMQSEYRNIEIVSPEEVQKIESTERWSDSTSQISFPGQVEDVETIPSDTEPVLTQCEPVSEYYTASSEVSLLSDVDPPEKTQTEDLEKEVKDVKKEGVIAGHVAAMRERFESMTRTNTPCPDLIRSLSPSLEVFRNISPSPDRLT